MKWEKNILHSVVECMAQTAGNWYVKNYCLVCKRGDETIEFHKVWTGWGTVSFSRTLLHIVGCVVG